MSPPGTASQQAPVHPLSFLQREPVISILGDPLHLDLPYQLLGLVNVSRLNATLHSFLIEASNAINQELIRYHERPPKLTFDTLRSVDTIRALFHASPETESALEIAAVFGGYIGACNGMDVNAPGAGAEENLHQRIHRWGRGGLIDLTRFGLAAIAIENSRSVADVCCNGIKCLRLALQLSRFVASLPADMLEVRLVISDADTSEFDDLTYSQVSSTDLRPTRPE